MLDCVPSEALSLNSTSRPGSRTGSGLSSSPFTIEKMAVFAPMPSVKVRIATTATPGWCRNDRTAYRRSLRRSCSHRPPLASRVNSVIGAMPPKAARARRRASSGGTPSLTRSRACAST